MALTKRKRAFVAEYCAAPKASTTEAAIKAGFSEKRAKVTACELMKDPEIKAAIRTRLEKRVEKIELTTNQVITELDQIRDAAIESGAGAWQMQTRLKVAELKGRHLKMWVERLEIGVDEDLIKRLEAGRKRAHIALPAKSEVSA